MNQETLSVTLKVFINYELERTILSYSDSVRIISPRSLQVKIYEKLKNAVKTMI
jgi:hypothetical protein